ncbi:surface-adhesin E family protein [Caulobacter sp. 17J65-9]|uniref:surface-adhesin E family protein n=1 Tax=Caulobacter sp. 17J65-9 TaxID=2709382 RepID=UPI0013C70A4F|nr:surface-adhesin E family protein [Caulobacter sp. 17J65-9]NEX93003.1 hypothetical protein [Caulobacter sp. 17J65-9]
MRSVVLSFALACALFAGPALAEDWQFVTMNKNRLTALDLDALERTSDGVVRVRVVHVNRPGAYVPEGVEAFGHMITTAELDCRANTQRLLTMGTYRPDGSLIRVDPLKLDWQTNSPGSVGELIQAFACGERAPDEYRLINIQELYDVIAEAERSKK